MATILVIDDDEGICKLFSKTMERMGHTVMSALTLGEGLKMCQSNPIDVVFLDVSLPDGNGIKSIPNATNGHLKNVASFEMKLSGPAGTSPSMKVSMKALSYASLSEVNVLLTGETGTGKGFYANAIHDNSLRKEHNFVLVDCTSIPETLVESALFGSEKGAFTDAKQSRHGLVKQADGGTLFLDEVSELPFNIQKSFLHVLDTHRYRPVGANKEAESDCRHQPESSGDGKQGVVPKRSFLPPSLTFHFPAPASGADGRFGRTGSLPHVESMPKMEDGPQRVFHKFLRVS